MKKVCYEHYLTAIEKSVRRNWEYKAVSNFGEDVSYTYGEMAMEVERVKEWLRRMGIGKGDKVAICARSSAHWTIAYLAIVTNGSTAVSILPDFTADNILYLTKHSDAKLLFVGDEVGRKIADLDFGETTVVNLLGWKVIKWVRGQVPDPVSDGSGTCPLTQIDARTDESKEEFLGWLDWHTGFTMDDLALINYTSGTTDKPKGVMVPSRALSSNVDFGQRNQPNGPGDQIVGMLPLAHIFGIMFDCLYQLAGGVHIVYLTKAPTPTLLMKAFAEVKPYMILTVPLLVEKIIFGKILPVMNKPAIQAMWLLPATKQIIRNKIRGKLLEAFGGKLRILIIGGAALNPEVDKCLGKLKFPYTCGYGMTESAPLVCYVDPKDFKVGSVGRLVDNIEVKFRSADPASKPGEIMLRGDNVFTGYYKNEEDTRKAFDEEGWFHTGDMGTIDKLGNITLRGRCKNMILGPSGQNIYPEEIEAKLQTMPRVIETIVLAREKSIVALVYPDYEGISREELRIQMGDNLAALNEWLPKYSQVGKIELVEKEFEKTPKNSIKRFMYK